MAGPISDSSRRDFTVNALYYNIHTDVVEDYTEHGLSDLQARVSRLRGASGGCAE